MTHTRTQGMAVSQTGHTPGSVYQRLEAEVEKAKAHWLRDPCFDLADIVREDPRLLPWEDELREFQRVKELEWKAARLERQIGYAQMLGCSPAMLDRIERIEKRLDELEGDVEELDEVVNV